MEKFNRNIDPHRPAKCAMWLFHERYCSSKLGSMDFWDSLEDSEKKICRRMSEEISCTRPETKAEFQTNPSL